MDKLKIGVTGTDSLIGQVIIKSILDCRYKESVSLIGFDYFPDTVGSYWVEKNHILPDFLKEDVSKESWLENLLFVIKEEGINILFIGIDFELKLFAKYKQRIEEETKCKVVVSNSDVINIADDKYLTYQFLKKNNFSYPKTILADKFDAERVSFPCIVKPRIGARSENVYVIHNQDELVEKISKKKHFIIQELVGDEQSEYTCGVVNFGADKYISIVLRRILKAGHTMTAFFDKNYPKIIDDYIKDITLKLDPFGPCNFQLRLTEDNVPKLFEINARHSGTTYIRSLFGFKEVEYVISHILGDQIEDINLREGCVKRYYHEIFIEKG